VKTRNLRTKILVIVAILTTVIMVREFWGTSPVKAARYTEEKSVSLGLARGQTTRFNAVNSRGTTALVINWKVLDSQGRVIAAPPEPHTIPPGETKSFDVSYDEINATPDHFGRIQLQGELEVFGGVEARRNLSISQEIFNDADGRTTVLNWPHP
jgi:hypothetical protein